jgi:hypothetical protein
VRPLSTCKVVDDTSNADWDCGLDNERWRKSKSVWFFIPEHCRDCLWFGGTYVKNYGTEIPIPTKLAKKLKAWKAKADKTRSLVSPLPGAIPSWIFLDCLKACSERTKIDKVDFFLHKFRSTFAHNDSGRALICGQFSIGLGIRILSPPCVI